MTSPTNTKKPSNPNKVVTGQQLRYRQTLTTTLANSDKITTLATTKHEVKVKVCADSKPISVKMKGNESSVMRTKYELHFSSVKDGF